MTDTQILDWLERNLISLGHVQSPQMDGVEWVGQMHNEARGSGAGPSYVRINHSSIRGAVEDAARWTKPVGSTLSKMNLSPAPLTPNTLPYYEEGANQFGGPKDQS